MGQPPASALEGVITEVGALLVQLHKFRTGVPQHPALLAEALALGDRARRRHHTQALDAAADAALVAAAVALRARLQALLAAIRGAPDYRAAVAAHAAGDHGALARLLPAVLDGVTPVPAPPFLWHAPPWLRRNRPLPAADMAAAARRVAAEGLAGDDDPLAPGLDPELPAVPLDEAPTGGDPVLLRWAGGDLPAAVFRLDASGQLVVHVARLRARFDVVLPDVLDEEELGEISVDWPRYRSELAAALAATGLPILGG